MVKKTVQYVSPWTKLYVVFESRVRNRYCIQAATHYLPKGYYGEPKVIVQNAKQMYKGVWHIKEISLRERLKGWMCAYLCGAAALLMKILASMRQRRAKKYRG